MTALRRTTTPRAMPMPFLDRSHICDQCHRHRAHGNHTKCSKARQKAYAQERKGNK